MNAMDEKVLSHEESLALITRMIQNTHAKLGAGSGSPFLIWGYTTVLTTLLVFVFYLWTNNPHTQWLWFLIPVLGGVLSWQRSSQNKAVRPVTYIDRMIAYIWLVCGIIGVVVSVLTMLTSVDLLGHWIWRFPILFVITLIMGMGTTLTGLAIRFKPVAAGGIVGLCGALALSFVAGIYQFPLFAAIFILMMIIPGHLLNAAARREQE
jgi:hypothetical protein